MWIDLDPDIFTWLLAGYVILTMTSGRLLWFGVDRWADKRGLYPRMEFRFALVALMALFWWASAVMLISRQFIPAARTWVDARGKEFFLGVPDSN
jgi:hypothetical protein